MLSNAPLLQHKARLLKAATPKPQQYQVRHWITPRYERQAAAASMSAEIMMLAAASVVLLVAVAGSLVKRSLSALSRSIFGPGDDDLPAADTPAAVTRQPSPPSAHPLPSRPEVSPRVAADWQQAQLPPLKPPPELQKSPPRPKLRPRRSGLGGEQITMAAVVRKAAETVGVDAGILLQLVSVESGFDPNARASTSSGTGLLQFVKSTWKGMVAQYGAQYGIKESDITDPWANALMGALLTRDNIRGLQRIGIKNPSVVDIYIAHFLGLAGAGVFFSHPKSTVGASILPQAAASNRSIFYHQDGRGRTLAEIYELFAQRLGRHAQTIGQAEPLIEAEYQRMSAAGWQATPVASRQPQLSTQVEMVGQTRPPKQLSTQVAMVGQTRPPKPQLSTQVAMVGQTRPPKPQLQIQNGLIVVADPQVYFG